MAYNAFISYSHTADVKLSAALQSALHTFTKPWYKLRALHIFRDQTNLAANPALWSTIREAIDQSLFFILLASPEAAISPWVAKEAEYWIGKNGTARVLIVLTGGTLQWDHTAASFTAEHSNSLPPAVLRAFAEEPLFVDLRWAREGSPRLSMREARFHEAVLELAATLHNRPKDELDGADVRSRRITRQFVGAGLLSILFIALFALFLWNWGRGNSIQNLAANLASSSAKMLSDSPDRAREAALLAIESNRLHPSFEGNQALRSAVSLLPAGEQLYTPEPGIALRVRDLAFSPDGVTLAVARDDGSTQLIDVGKHKAAGFFTPDQRPAAQIQLASGGDSPDDDAAVSVAFNAQGSLVATGARDGMAHVWSVPEGREMLRIVHGVPVSQLSFHPKTEQLVTASDDGHVRVFDVARAVMVADFKSPGKPASVSWSPDGNLIATLSSDGDVALFDAVHRRLIRTLQGGEAGFHLAFSANGKRLAIAGGDYAIVWDVATGRQLLKATHAVSNQTLTPQQWIYDAAITSDGALLAYAARGDRTAHVWSVETGRQILELPHDSAVEAVAFNADGTKLGTGSDDGTARVWELPSGRELERGTVAGGANTVAFSKASSRFAAGGMAARCLLQRRVEPIALPGSICCPMSAAWLSDRTASASQSPGGRRGSFLWCASQTSLEKRSGISNFKARPPLTSCFFPIRTM